MISSGVAIWTIRIYHECDGGIEKSVLRITNWHHKACRVMTIGSSKGLGAAIMLEGKPIAYASCALTETQQRYSQCTSL